MLLVPGGGDELPVALDVAVVADADVDTGDTPVAVDSDAVAADTGAFTAAAVGAALIGTAAMSLTSGAAGCCAACA